MQVQASTPTRFANRLTAAFTAFALSLVMISGTVTVPSAEARTTYVGELA